MARFKIGKIKVPTRDDLVKFSKTEPTGENKPLLWAQPLEGENKYPVVAISFDNGTHELVLTKSDNTESRIDLSTLMSSSGSGGSSVDVNNMILDNNKPIKAKLNDANNTTVQLMKTSIGNGIEVGDKSVVMNLVAKELKTWDGTSSSTLLSTKHYGTAIYSKNQVDAKIKALEDRIKALGG